MTGQSPLTTGTALAHIELAFLLTWKHTNDSRKADECEITDIGLVGRKYQGAIVEFDKINAPHLHILLAKSIPVHYQWFPTSTRPFDPKELRAMDYHTGLSLRPQTSMACASRKGKECETSPKHPAGPLQKKRAKYFAVQKKGEEDKGCRISRNEYKRLTEWCVGVHKQLPEGVIFYAYENDAEDEDDAAPAGAVVSAKDLAAHEVKNLMAALPREEPSTCSDTMVAPAVVTQGVMTAEPEISPAAVTQGVMTPGPLNDEPAPVVVTAPIAKAIEVPVTPKPVPNNGAESPVSLGEGEAPFTPDSPIAPWIAQDDYILPMDRFTKSPRLPSPQAMPRPLSPPVSRAGIAQDDFILPMDRFTKSPRLPSPQAMPRPLSPPVSRAGIAQDDFVLPMDRFTKSPRLPLPQDMPRPLSPPVSRAVLSKSAGRLMETPAAVEAGKSCRDAGSSRDGRSYSRDNHRAYERRMSHPHHYVQANSRYGHRPAYNSSRGPSLSYVPLPMSSTTRSSSAFVRPPSPRCEECQVFPSDRSFIKRKFSSELESSGHTGENNRFCPEDRQARRPTLSDHITDGFSVGPSPWSSGSLLDRIHIASKIPGGEEKKKQVPNPHAEQVPTLVLGPSMSQGVVFPTAPVHHSGRLITMFRSAIRIVYNLLANPNASPVDSIPALLRCGAPFQVISSVQYDAPTHLEVRPLYLATKRTHIGLDLSNPGYWNTYVATVQQLLNHSFARHFLMVGGIIWRVALQFGPNMLVQEALAGPSSDVTRWKSGEMLDDLWDDTVTPAELEVLLGQGLESSVTCWPPHDIWTSSTRWSGYWSEKDESWFQLQLANLSSGNTDAPKSRKDWKRFYKPITDNRSDDPSIHGSEAFACDVFLKLGYHVDRDPIWNLGT
ncbi:hypothetical protein EV424DRAFT_1351262 [Suillus variegatus]|nr:hypothetical protein EV424DRAFT_1351262 [Suillus variegatus]